MILGRGGELVRERLRRSIDGATVQDCVESAIAWLYAAQDATPDRGVSHSYLIGRGWLRSYPETTGYIIPTLLNWGRLMGEPVAEQRALEMADWEIEVQLDDGAIPDLRDGSGVIFDTGQVIFGWLAAYGDSGEERFLEAAHRGAKWLLEQLGEDGIWRSAVDAGGPGRVYNARAAWSLAELGRITGDPSFEGPVRRFLDWTLKQEQDRGWFAQNCLTNDDTPLLHTIAYTARGQLETGLLLEESRYVEAARRTAGELAALVRPDGFLAGRFDRRWQPAVSWACLTGMAQISIVWRRLAAVASPADENGQTSADAFLRAARSVNAFLIRTQDRSSSNSGLRGGIRGSYPINGNYGQWSVLNWATKFFVDALMFDLPGDGERYPG